MGRRRIRFRARIASRLNSPRCFGQRFAISCCFRCPRCFQNDDTKMKILSLGRESAPALGSPEESSRSSERTGLFTSGIVSTKQGQRIALFFTGRRHAGENFAQVLARRAAGLSPPIQMAMAFRGTLPSCRRRCRSSSEL